MHQNDYKDMLKEILRRASLDAKQQKLGIDFNAGFALVAHPDWKLVIFDKRSTTIDYDKLRYVYDASDNSIVIPSHDARLARMPSKVLYMDRLDEYDYLIPLDVYRTIIEKLCVSGAYVKVKHPKHDEILDQCSKDRNNVVNKLKKYKTEHPEISNIVASSFYTNLIASHNAKWLPLRHFIEPIKLDIVPTYVTSIEALHIWLDLNAV